MPYPLAHPAAVLPLRRFCPQWLSLPALIVGSLSPDMAYAFVGLELQRFSHQLVGAVAFCLPAGLLALWVLHRLSPWAVRSLPDAYRGVLLPQCERPLGSPLVLAVSVLVGALTHLFLDSFTHKDGWMTEHWAVLQIPLYQHEHRTLRVCHILWYLCTFVGVTWVCLAYQEWLAKANASAGVATGSARWGNSLLFAGALMILSVSHYLTRHWSANFVEGACMLLIVAVFAMRTGTLPETKNFR